MDWTFQELHSDLQNLILCQLSRRDLVNLALVSKWTLHHFPKWRLQQKNRLIALCYRDISVFELRMYSMPITERRLMIIASFARRDLLDFKLGSDQFSLFLNECFGGGSYTENVPFFDHALYHLIETNKRANTTLCQILVKYLPNSGQRAMILKLGSINVVYFLIKLNWRYRLGLTSLLVRAWRRLYSTSTVERLSFDAENLPGLKFVPGYLHFISDVVETKKRVSLYLLEAIKPYLPGEYHLALRELKLTPGHYFRLLQEELRQPYSSYFQSLPEIYAYYQPLIGYSVSHRFPQHNFRSWSLYVNRVPRDNANEPEYLLLKAGRRVRVHYRFGRDMQPIAQFNQLAVEEVQKELRQQGDFGNLLTRRNLDKIRKADRMTRLRQQKGFLLEAANKAITGLSTLPQIQELIISTLKRGVSAEFEELVANSALRQYLEHRIDCPTIRSHIFPNLDFLCALLIRLTDQWLIK